MKYQIPLPPGYESIEAQIRRARAERSVIMGQAFADGVDALCRAVSRVSGAILTSFSNARDAATIEADVLMKRGRARSDPR